MQLQHHGGYIHPECKPIPSGDGQGTFGQSTSQDRPETKGKGIIKRFRKDANATGRPVAFGWIKASYSQAIEYTGITNDARGVVLFFGFLALIGSAWMMCEIWPSPDLWQDLVGGEDLIDAFFHIVMALLCLLWPSWMLLWTGRMELFRPVDEPVIFDRQHRKVYRIFREHIPGWRGLFKPWPLFAVTYDWDLIDAEHNAAISATGAGVSQQNALTFFVRKSVDDPTIIDFFNVGQIMALTEQSVPAVWEHIRRFMEEDGPHLPPGETVHESPPPVNFWHAMRGVLPMGREPVGQWMASHPFFTLIFLLLSPVFAPIWLVWGFGNWLSHKTAVPIRWPDEVLQAIGAATAGQSSGVP